MRVTVNDIEFYINQTQKCAIVTANQGVKRQHICIPEIVNGYPVKAISSFAFKDKTELRMIRLPNSISQIQTSAFAGCSELLEVSFYPTTKATLTLVVNDHAFLNCSKLKHFLAIANTDINCGIEAFKNCRNLEKVQGCLLQLENNCFENCFKLDNLIFAHCTWWKTETFKGCSLLRNMTFYGDVEELLSRTCMKWLSKRNIRCCPNTSLAELAYSGAKVEFI